MGTEPGHWDGPSGGDLALRAEHVSNAGLKEPSPGIRFLQLRYQYWF